jgi:hypothetical protein
MTPSLKGSKPRAARGRYQCSWGRPYSLFYLNLDEHHFGLACIDDVVMHPGGSPVGIARSDKRSAFAAIRVLQSHIAIGDRRDHIVIPMLVPAGFCAWGKGKSGDTGTVVINQLAGAGCGSGHWSLAALEGADWLPWSTVLQFEFNLNFDKHHHVFVSVKLREGALQALSGAVRGTLAGL